jgi:hypothetical protein
VGEGPESDSWHNVYFDHPTIDLGCTCDLTVDGQLLTFRYSLNLLPTRPNQLLLDREQLLVAGGPFGGGGVALLENGQGEVRLLDETLYPKADRDACYQATSTPHIGVTMLSLLYDRQANRHALAFRDYLASWQGYDLCPRCMRDDRIDQQATQLAPDGANLASVLFNLKNRDERLYRQWVGLVRTVEPRLDALNFVPPGKPIVMQLTDGQDHRFPLGAVSNGTLRFMALCYIILSNAGQDNPPLVIVEEPENGLYVRCLKPLFELIDPEGAGGQYVFTSHSPYFVDLFDSQLENVTLMQYRDTHSTLLKPDPAQVRKYLEEMPLGELHFREMLV